MRHLYKHVTLIPMLPLVQTLILIDTTRVFHVLQLVQTRVFHVLHLVQTLVLPVLGDRGTSVHVALASSKTL